MQLRFTQEIKLNGPCGSLYKCWQVERPIKTDCGNDKKKTVIRNGSQINISEELLRKIRGSRKAFEQHCTRKKPRECDQQSLTIHINVKNYPYAFRKRLTHMLL